MKQLHFQLPNNSSALHDELLSAVPGLRPVPNQLGELEPLVLVESKGDDIWLALPDDADEADVAAVVLAHDPGKIQPGPRQQRLDRIIEILAIPRSTWTSAQMRELIDLTAQEISA